MADIVDISTAAPSARFKVLDRDDKRLRCPHKRIEVWPKEPIIECADCGAVVDPFQWIRDRCADWKQMVASVDWKVADAKRELEELKREIRLLRKEFKDEAEKEAASRRLMVMPPRKSF